jgi:enoyl-CoA hydratase
VSELVLVEVAEAVATVTINRPEKRNALSIELRVELAGALERTAADPSVAVVVLTGAGTAFCAGMDRSQFGGDADHKRRLYETSARLFEVLGDLPRPAIAAVNGPALGGGFALAAACDLRIAGPAATFGHPEITFGVPPSYATLIRALPDQVAREMAFTGRIVGADEALALGIVREVHADPLARARAVAREMSAHGARVLEQTKRMIVEASRAGAAAAAYEAEMALFRKTLLGE